MIVINRSLNEDEIYNITEAFRMAILDAKYDRRFQYRDRMSNFPGGCCDDASDLLAYYLLEKYNIHTNKEMEFIVMITLNILQTSHG